MSVKKKIPQIRFKIFSGQWVQSNLAKCTDLLTGNPFNSKEFTAEGILLVRGMNVKRGYLDVSPEISEFWPSSKGLENYLLEPEDIVIQMDGALIGKSYAKIESINLPAILVQRVTRVRCSEVNPEFIYQYIQKDFLNHISGIKTETAVPHLSLHDIRGFSVSLPKRSEQNAIGNYFQKLDTLINRHQQKYDKLGNFKKSLLGKMFPKQGETMPEIRFKGFSGEWEEKELGELAEIVRGASPRPIEDPKWFDSESSVGWLRIRDVTEQDGRIHFLEQRISKLGQEKTRVLHERHLLLSIAASVGKPVVNYVETGVHDGFLIFKKPLFELEFMYQWLKSFETKWQQFGQPGSQVNLNSDIVKNLTVTIPTNEEQAAIGNYFQKLDALINQHQQQITKLNNIKQACLSKMFV
ncbi:restriction endonuclease subunit S [Leclercia sp. G3L]|uniref:restriction endonuclease subunit S n=1 Tax=Leclercia sp. G3L TaxID=2898725 RepID=UPI001E37C8C5|nr:restriction endonuclease subunit S [Leclercia sp. G3L]UGB03331.1 restriction endonuclease subunit S [Leclercia sp. G3L]